MLYLIKDGFKIKPQCSGDCEAPPKVHLDLLKYRLDEVCIRTKDFNIFVAVLTKTDKVLYKQWRESELSVSSVLNISMKLIDATGHASNYLANTDTRADHSFLFSCIQNQKSSFNEEYVG